MMFEFLKILLSSFDVRLLHTSVNFHCIDTKLQKVIAFFEDNPTTMSLLQTIIYRVSRSRYIHLFKISLKDTLVIVLSYGRNRYMFYSGCLWSIGKLIVLWISFMFYILSPKVLISRGVFQSVILVGGPLTQGTKVIYQTTGPSTTNEDVTITGSFPIFRFSLHVNLQHVLWFNSL